MAREVIEKQAKYLADENRKNDPDITDVFWFPDEDEVRLVEVNPTVLETSTDEGVQPFYFRPAPASNLPAPSGVALIRPEEVGKLTLPKKWGKWDAAVPL